MSLTGAAKTKRHWYEIIIRYFRSVEGHGAIIFFFLYIFLQGLYVSVLVKSVAFLTVLPLSTLYTLLLITFWLFAKGQWSCISNIRFRKARKKGSLIYLLRVIFMFMLILMCIFYKRKRKKKERNTFRILSIRVPWTSTTKHGDANLFVSFDILRYLHGNTQCKHVSTSTVPSWHTTRYVIDQSFLSYEYHLRKSSRHFDETLVC